MDRVHQERLEGIEYELVRIANALEKFTALIEKLNAPAEGGVGEGGPDKPDAEKPPLCPHCGEPCTLHEVRIPSQVEPVRLWRCEPCVQKLVDEGP